MSKFLWAWFWSRKCFNLCELALWTLPLLEGIAFTWACEPFLTWTKPFYLRVSTSGRKFPWGYGLFFTLGRSTVSVSLMVFASVRVHLLCERSFGSVAFSSIWFVTMAALEAAKVPSQGSCSSSRRRIYGVWSAHPPLALCPMDGTQLLMESGCPKLPVCFLTWWKCVQTQSSLLPSWVWPSGQWMQTGT